MLIIDGAPASDTPGYSRSRFAARTYFAVPYSKQTEYASISNDVFPGLHADHVESPRDFDFGGGEILLDLISPGIMIPNHSRWHTIFFIFFIFFCPKRFRSTRVMVVAFASHWQDVKSFDSRAATTRSNTWHCWDNIRRTKDLEPHNGFFVKDLPSKDIVRRGTSKSYAECLLNAVFGLLVPWFQLVSLNYHLHPNHWFCGIVGPLMRNSFLVCAWQLGISVCSRFVIMH